MTVIVFDLDGVLIDSKRMYVELIKKTLEENGQKIPFKEIYEQLIPSIKGTIEIVVPKHIENRVEVINQAEKRVIELTTTEGLDYIKLSKDSARTLQLLKKENNLFLLSNSHSIFINKVLGKYNHNQYFDEVITLDSGFSSKDKAIKHISKTQNVSLANIFYIGDTKEDIKLAKRTGCKTIIIFNEISWDYPNKQKILVLKPDFVIDKLSDLVTFSF